MSIKVVTKRMTLGRLEWQRIIHVLDLDCVEDFVANPKIWN